jgi:biotin-dependent carboxylase-like uncharacterized protein
VSAHRTALEVVDPGPLALVQDLGRAGWASIGVGRSGAFDRAAHALAQRLVGGDEHAAGIELLGGGFAVRALEPCVVAVTGADGPLVRDRFGTVSDVARRGPVHLDAGDVMRVGGPTHGLRSYLAVRGGVRAPKVLGSASYDTLARLGPAPLAAGDVLPVGRAALGFPVVDHAPERPAASPLVLLPGPRADWFTDDALEALGSGPWTVSADSDRVGLRLEGPALQRRDPGRELPSEPLVRGAVQVPPDGRPVVLGPDHPTTGGYPVVAVLADTSSDRLAQARPGDRLSFAVAYSPLS